MKSQVKKIGYAGMLVLLVVWWMGHAEGGGGDGKSLVGRLKSMYLSLKARMDGVEQRMDGVEQRMGGVEQRMGGVEQRMGGVEKQVVDVKEVSKRSKKQAGLAEADAKDAKARAAAAENEARAAVRRARVAEQRARAAEQEVADVRKKGVEIAKFVVALERQLKEQQRAFQAFKEVQEEQSLRLGGRGGSFWWKGVLFKARWIPAGSFMMGSPDSDSEAFSDEKPQRLVTLTRGFWMMETEVTQAQYKAVMGYNPSGNTSCGDTCPVEKVSWHEAALFANKLSEARQQPKCFVCKGEGKNAYCDAWGNKGSDYIGCKGWRLPTEAEWEYAARAGTSTSRYGAVDSVGWHSGNSGGKTQPVWKKQPNAWGLYDMLGNVWEWCYDGWDSSAYTKLGAVDPVYVADSSYRVKRGGSCSWSNHERYLRAANRSYASTKGSNLGFRLLRR